MVENNDRIVEFFSKEMKDIIAKAPENAIGWTVTKISGKGFSFEYVLDDESREEVILPSGDDE